MPVPPRYIAFCVKGDSSHFFERLRHINRPATSADDLQEEALKWSQVVVLLNPTSTQVLSQLLDAATDTMCPQVVDARQAAVQVIRGPAIRYVYVEGRSAAVVRKASRKDASSAQLNLRLDAVSDSY